MAQIQKGDTFADGQQVTGARLNQFLDSAIVLPNIITDQTNIATNGVANGDAILLYDLSATALREATASDLLNSNLAVTTSSITGGAGVNLVITPASTYKVDVAGAFEADSINSVGATTIGGTLAVTGNASFTAGIGGTSAIKIATGTTAERPASPVAGQLRFNTTSNTLEVYSGSAWINGVTSGSALFDGTVNITGAIQYNGKPVYGVYEWYDGYNFLTGGTAVGYTGNKLETTSANHTKGAGERWQINVSVAFTSYDQAYRLIIKGSNNVVYYTSSLYNNLIGTSGYDFRSASVVLTSEEFTNIKFYAIVESENLGGNCYADNSGSGNPYYRNNKISIDKWITA
jgi:hypothetical protein